MNSTKLISPLFYLSAAYDGILGLLFLFAPLKVFELFQVPPPNHIGYVQFPALLLIIFGMMFFVIAKDPSKYRDLIIYGIMLKLSYCCLTALYWAQGTLPDMWKPFTVCDAVMCVLYILCYKCLSQKEQSA